MALIIDPDQLNRGTEIVINTTLKTVQLIVAGNLSTDGVTLQCVYSFLKEEWKSDADLPKFLFPLLAITEEKFEVINGWDWADSTTRNLIRTGGWALKDTNGNTQEEYAGVITLGDIGAGDQVYYQQSNGGSSSNIVLTGPVNQAVKIYGDVTHGNINYRSYFKMFVREFEKLYDVADLNDIGVSTMTYQVYRFPLANATDLKIETSDGNVDTLTPYTGMSIEWFVNPVNVSIGGSNYPFHVFVDGNQGTAEEIYTFVQRQLRKATDIDSGAGVRVGKVTNELLRFVGDTLYTIQDGTYGVFINDFQTGDTNRLIFTDDSGVERQFPFVANLLIQFGDNLQQDPASIYRVFFTDDSAGTGAGNNFGSAGAITLQDNDKNYMQGYVSARTSVSHSYDYDGNNQRRGSSAGKDAPITVIAIGTTTAQYVTATGTILRSTANQVSLVAALERNYVNP